jgi:hypothetical protein
MAITKSVKLVPEIAEEVDAGGVEEGGGELEEDPFNSMLWNKGADRLELRLEFEASSHWAYLRLVREVREGGTIEPDRSGVDLPVVNRPYKDWGVKEVPLHVQHRLKPMHDLSKPERDTTDSRTEKGTELGAFLFHWFGIIQIISSYFIGLMMGSDSRKGGGA